MTGRHPEDDAAETVTADRDPLADEAAETIVVDRQLDAETIVVEREAREDGTVAVTRARPAAPVSPALTRGRRRRGMTAPPVAPGYGRGAVEASGPGAVATYEPRATPRLPADPPAYPGVEATRVVDAGMPSVRRRSRRAAILTLALFAAACVVSAVGLVAIAVGVLG